MSDEMKEPNNSGGEEQAESREHNRMADVPADPVKEPTGSNDVQREAASADQSSGAPPGGSSAENDEERTLARLGDDASNPADESNSASNPFSPNYQSSALEQMLDRIALSDFDYSIPDGPHRDYYDAEDPSPLIDLIRESRTSQIHVSLFQFLESKPTLVHGPEVDYEGRKHRVPELPTVVANSLVLPSWVADYGKTRDLFDTVQSLLKAHLPLPKDNVHF